MNKFSFYRWLAGLLPHELIAAAILRAIITTGEPAGNGQFYDMPISLLVERWDARRERWFHWHWQNLDDKKKRGWKNGRAWWRFFGDYLELRAEWLLLGHSSTAIGFDFAGDDDFQVHLAINRLFSIWLTVHHFKPLSRFFSPIARNFGYETSLKIFDGSLWFHFAFNEMWGARTFHRWWIPNWISVWLPATYKEYPAGPGFYVTFNFNRLILGSRKMIIEDIGEPKTVEIPIEPDNSMGLHYFAEFQKEKVTRYRSHFPWWKTVQYVVRISCDNPPLHAGKGENSYDLDDDGIFGVTYEAQTIEEAIAKYQESVYSDRKRYGAPNYAQQGRPSVDVSNSDIPVSPC